MAATLETLRTYYANDLRVGAANIPPADATLLATLAAQVDARTITLFAAQQTIAKLAINTTSVANLAYNFFTGATLTSGGLDYLVSPTGGNANNLNSAYYQSFSLENRYINFAVNLGKLGEGATRFAAEYGSLTLEQAVTKAYLEIFGVSRAGIEGILTADVGGQTRAQYFAYYGKDGLTGLGTKAAMVGWLLAEAAKADTGNYARAETAFLADLAPDGQAAFQTNIVSAYGPAPATVLRNSTSAALVQDTTPAGEFGVDIYLQNFMGAPSTSLDRPYRYGVFADGGFIGVRLSEHLATGPRDPTVTLHVETNSTAGVIYAYTQSDLSPNYEGPVNNLRIIGPGSLKAQIAGNFLNVDATQAGNLDLTYSASVFGGGAGVFKLGAGTNQLRIVNEFAAKTYVMGAGVDTVAIGGADLNGGSQTALNNLILTNQSVNAPFEIVGFAKGVDHLVLDSVIHGFAADVQQYVAGATSLTQALSQVSSHVAANQGAVFVYLGDTYIYAQDGVAGLNGAQGSPGDGLIKLVGVTGLTLGTGAASVDIHYG